MKVNGISGSSSGVFRLPHVASYRSFIVLILGIVLLLDNGVEAQLHGSRITHARRYAKFNEETELGRRIPRLLVDELFRPEADFQIGGRSVKGVSANTQHSNSAMDLIARDPELALVVTNATSSLNLSEAQTVIQNAVDQLTCTGVGGLVEVLTGLASSGSLSNGSLGILSILPTGLVNITSSNNTYAVLLPNFSITINGIAQSNLTIVIVIHVALAILGFFILVPIALMMETGREIALLVGMPRRWINVWKYSIILQGVAVALIVGMLVLGIMANGNASHFHTAHQFLGYITTAVGFICVILNVLYNRLKMNKSNINKHFSRARFAMLNVGFGVIQIALFTGLADLDTITLCMIALPKAMLVPIGGAVTQFLWMVMAFVALQSAVKKWIKKNEKEDGGTGELQILTRQESTKNAGPEMGGFQTRTGRYNPNVSRFD